MRDRDIKSFSIVINCENWPCISLNYKLSVIFPQLMALVGILLFINIVVSEIHKATSD